jgi:2-keto-4-pentenoate hydratase
MSDNHDKLAIQLAEAWRNGTTIALPTTGPASRAEAYAIQDKMAAAIGDPVVGWKVGAAVKAVQFFEGHDGPLPGRVFEDRAFETDGEVSAEFFNGAKVESEFAIELTEALSGDGAPITASDLTGKVVFRPAIELAATRYAPGTGSRGTTTFDGIADNGTAGAAVIGAAVENWQDLDFENMTIEARIEDSPPIQAYSGIYRRHPVDIMAETINDLNQRGITFEAGMFLLTGSLTLPIPFRKGQTLTVSHGDHPPLSLKMT